MTNHEIALGAPLVTETGEDIAAFQVELASFVDVMNYMESTKRNQGQLNHEGFAFDLRFTQFVELAAGDNKSVHLTLLEPITASRSVDKVEISKEIGAGQPVPFITLKAFVGSSRAVDLPPRPAPYVPDISAWSGHTYWRQNS